MGHIIAFPKQKFSCYKPTWMSGLLKWVGKTICIEICKGYQKSSQKT